MLSGILPVHFVLSFAFFRYEMQIVSECGACLSLKGELAQEHLRITYMQIIETTTSLSKAVLLYSHMVSHGLIFSHLLKILYW